MSTDLAALLQDAGRRLANELNAGAREIAKHSAPGVSLARQVVSRSTGFLGQAVRGEISRDDAEIALRRESDALRVLISDLPAEAALTEAAIRLQRALEIAREVGLAGLKVGGAAIGGALLA